MNPDFWKGKKVFLTGHTGFKGSWLSLILHRFGARVNGYSIDIPTKPSLFELCGLEKQVATVWGDINDADKLRKALQKSKPDIVIHMAAQALVRRSYDRPLETYQTNVIGTANVLEAVRQTDGIRAALMITTDKCYLNQERSTGFKESDPLGGDDPYSSSKAAAEIVIAAYRRSFFSSNGKSAKTGVASVRAGNVIGGGDWAEDRLIPDAIKAFSEKKPLLIRYPNAIRPWQHVLDPLRGYLMLIEKMWEDAAAYSEAWNFGPDEEDAQPVRSVVEYLVENWGEKAAWKVDGAPKPHEATFLKLNCDKAKSRLHWAPKWRLKKSLDEIIKWHRAHKARKDMRQVTLEQIDDFIGSAVAGKR